MTESNPKSTFIHHVGAMIWYPIADDVSKIQETCTSHQEVKP